MTKKDESILFSKALSFASEKHAGQMRRNKSPYIYHPFRVAKRIADAGYGIRYQIAGLFHDLLEDTDATENEIKKYGEDILEAVKLVSKNYCDDKSTYLDNILENHMATVVKNADRIDNLMDACTITDLKFQKRYLKESKELYKGRFSKELDNAIIALERKIKEIESNS